MSFKVFTCFIIAVFILTLGACSSSPGGSSSGGGSSSSTSSIPAANSFSLTIGGSTYTNKGYATNMSTNSYFAYLLSDNYIDATNGVNALEVMFPNTITGTGTYSATNFSIMYTLNFPANKYYILISGNVTLSSYANSPGQSFIGSITGSCIDKNTNFYSMSGSFNIVR